MKEMTESLNDIYRNTVRKLNIPYLDSHINEEDSYLRLLKSELMFQPKEVKDKAKKKVEEILTSPYDENTIKSLSRLESIYLETTFLDELVNAEYAYNSAIEHFKYYIRVKYNDRDNDLSQFINSTSL